MPDAPPQPGAGRHVVRFEVSGETLALLREARIALADATGEHLDHDALLTMLCRAVLDGADGVEPTRARSQVALTVCESCERGWQDGGGTPSFAHHEALHDGRLEIRGRVSTGLTFTHADGRPYGTTTTTIDSAWIEDAVAAIHGTGFTLAQARAAVAAGASHVGAAATLEALIRSAFQQLHRERRT